MLKRIIFLVAIFFPIVVNATEELGSSVLVDESESCISFEDCVSKVNEIIQLITDEPDDFYRDAYAIAHRLSDFGDDAIDQVIPLLNHQGRYSKRIATTVLLNFKHIDDKHFEAITNEINSSDASGQLILVVASIESDRATEFVVNKFLSTEWKNYYKAQSLSRLGDRVLPYLDKLVSSDLGQHFSAISGDVAAITAAHFLVDQALDESKTDDFVTKKLSAIGFIGVTDEELDEKLLRLRLSRTNLTDDFFNKLFIDIGSVVAADIYLAKLSSYKIEDSLLTELNKLENSSDIYKKLQKFIDSDQKYVRVVIEENEVDQDNYQYVAELFKNNTDNEISVKTTFGDGRFEEITNVELLHELLFEIGYDLTGNGVNKVGYEVSQLLYSGDESIQRSVIETLAEIGYEQSWSEIATFLYNENLLLVRSAINALMQLEVEDSTSDLIAISEQHWYPLIRTLSEEAVEEIDGSQLEADEPYEEIIIVGGRRGIASLDLKACENYSAKKKDKPHAEKLYLPDSKEQLEKLMFEEKFVRYADSSTKDGQDFIKRIENKLKSEPSFIDKTSMVELLGGVAKVPTMGFKHNDGWLLVTTRDEFAAGGLSFLDKDNKVSVLLEEDVFDVFKIDNDYFVINPVRGRTTIYKLSYSDKKWFVDKWFVLPDITNKAWLTDSGELFLEMSKKGIGVVLPQDRQFRMAECAE